MTTTIDGNEVPIKPARQRVDHKKEWYVTQLALAEMRLHQADCRIRQLEGQTFGAWVNKLFLGGQK